MRQQMLYHKDNGGGKKQLHAKMALQCLRAWLSKLKKKTKQNKNKTTTTDRKCFDAML